MKRILISVFSALGALHLQAATLDDLKKLEITCFVPAWLPDGIKLTKVDVTDDSVGPDAEAGRHFPCYALEYDDGHGRGFSIDSAYEGVGDRNLMSEEDTEETSFRAPVGEIFIIYRPAGKEGRKVAIQSNWVRDDEMQSELKAKDFKPGTGRFHGFTGNNLTLAEFKKIVDSLHPVRETKAAAAPTAPSASKPAAAAASALKIHPKVFDLVDCWLSDSEAPVVTEISLDAVEKDGNEFQDELVKPDGEWTRYNTPDANGGFMRYRVLEQKGNRYKVDFQENGGGSLTTSTTIEFVIDQREVNRNGKPAKLRVLRVVGYEHSP